jgi:hypothetical protein
VGLPAAAWAGLLVEGPADLRLVVRVDLRLAGRVDLRLAVRVDLRPVVRAELRVDPADPVATWRAGPVDLRVADRRQPAR